MTVTLIAPNPYAPSSPPRTFVSPLEYVVRLQERVGVPVKNGVWDDILTDALLERLKQNLSASSVPVMTLVALKENQTPVTAAEASAAGWVFFYDPPRAPLAPGEILPEEGVRINTTPSSVTVQGWTNFRYGTNAPAPPQEMVPATPGTPQPIRVDDPPMRPIDSEKIMGIPKPLAKAGAGFVAGAAFVAAVSKILPKRGS